MALLVKIVRDPGGGSALTKLLKCENISTSLERKVTTIQIPGETVLQLDLGRGNWSIGANGIADNTLTATGAGGIANYKDLTEMKTWSSSYIVRLYFDTNSYGVGKITRLDLRKESGQDYWKWEMDFPCESLVVAA